MFDRFSLQIRALRDFQDVAHMAGLDASIHADRSYGYPSLTITRQRDGRELSIIPQSKGGMMGAAFVPNRWETWHTYMSRVHGYRDGDSVIRAIKRFAK